MTQTKKTQLEIKVLSINTINEYALKCIQHELKFYSQFIGIDIFKVDGSIKQKYLREKLSFEGKLKDSTYFNIHYWFEKTRYSFDINIKSCINGGSYEVKPVTAFCQYEQISFSLFSIKNNLLENREIDLSRFKKVYKCSEILKNKIKVDKAASNYELALKTIPHEFRDVLYINRLTR